MRPSRDEVLSVMSGLADRVEACAQSDRAWTAVVEVHFAPADGRAVDASVADAPSLEEAECVVDAMSQAVLAPFCTPLDAYPVRYPYRVPAVVDADAGSDDSGGDDDAGADGTTGTLRVNTRPWSHVYIEDELIGATPQLAIELPAGSHVVTLVNDDFGITRVVRVTVVAGEVTTLVLSLIEEQ